MIFKVIYETLDGAWQWLAERIFVRFEFDLPVELIKELSREGKVCFSLTSGGFIEWLILSSWSRKQGLDAILVANRKHILLFSKPLYCFQILFRRKKYADLYLSHRSGPQLIFCRPHERKKLFVPTPTEKIIASTYTGLAQEQAVEKYFYIPVLFLWRKYGRGGGQTSWFEYLLGSSASPNIMGKVWYLLRKRRDSTIRSLTPFHLGSKDLPETTALPDESEANRVGRIARRKILVSIQQEMRVILGPRYDTPHLIKEHLLRDPEIQAFIRTQALETGVDQKKLLQIAYNYFTEIVASYKHRTIERLFLFLTYLFTKVFDGVVYSREEIARLRELLKTKSVVFVSCHRSHFDYLVMPYVLYGNDLSTPHIAAGINLSFWPMGPFLRTGGAFFIRRSFRGNLLYSLCLKKYVQYLIRHRTPFKFFIEGTRSRTGKMLAPAYGLLKTVITAVEQKTVEEVALVPVSIAYDEVPEERSYTSELGGAQKQKESAGQLLRSRSIVKRRMGRVHLAFGEPISVRDIYLKAQATQMDSTLMVQKAAFQASKSICDVTPITVKAIVSTVMLNKKKPISLEQILELADWIMSYVQYSKHPLGIEPDVSPRRAVEQIVYSLRKKGHLEVLQDTVPRQYLCPPQKRTLLTYYKNTALHCTVIPAITFLAYQQAARSGEASAEKVDTYSIELRNLLKFEFFFNATAEFLEEIKKSRIFLEKSSQTATLDQEVYTRGIGYLLESYLLAVKALSQLSANNLDKKQLLGEIVRYSVKIKEDSGMLYPESLSIQNFTNSLMFMEHQELLALETKSHGVLYKRTGKSEKEKEIIELIQSYLDLIENPEAVDQRGAHSSHLKETQAWDERSTPIS